MRREVHSTSSEMVQHNAQTTTLADVEVNLAVPLLLSTSAACGATPVQALMADNSSS